MPETSLFAMLGMWKWKKMIDTTKFSMYGKVLL